MQLHSRISRSFLYFLSSSLFFFLQNIYCQVSPGNESILTAIRINKQIELTGKLDDPAWATAVAVELKYEVIPGDNTPAPQKTFVKAIYDKNNIYFGFQCFDSNPEDIRANISDRDKLYQDDWVMIAIDTYGNFERSYELAVNPFGVKGDLLATMNGEDSSIDFIWEAEASTNKEGWTAEIMIPFSSLKMES